MSFIYSRALVEAFSPASFEETDASVQSSESHTPKPCLWHDKTTGRFPLSRFGMTCAPLTDDRGAGLLTSLLVGFRVRTSARPELVMGSMESAAGSGQRWRGSFAKYSPDESKWKTAQCSLLGDSDEFLETWPRWGSMRNGESFLRQIPALTICESASGFWPTPNARDWKGAPGKGCMERGGRQSSLPAAIKMWPTPCASASKGSSPSALTRKDGKDRSNDRIDHAVMASDGGQLNPEWVEWLMGWPIGHTALKPLETAKYQEWLQQHSPYSQTNDKEAA